MLFSLSYSQLFPKETGKGGGETQRQTEGQEDRQTDRQEQRERKKKKRKQIAEGWVSRGGQRQRDTGKKTEIQR